MSFRPLISLLFIGFLSGCSQTTSPKNSTNVILIIVDDMGFSDLGGYGSEIDTPNIDRLA